MKKPLAEKLPEEMLSLSLFSMSCGPPNLQEIEDGF